MRKDKERYFYTFQVHGATMAGWMGLTTNPYHDIFIKKFTEMEQAGIMARLHGQYQVVKAVDPEPLEPLKLEHFYITFIGIACGLLFALVAFAVERFKCARLFPDRIL